MKNYGHWPLHQKLLLNGRNQEAKKKFTCQNISVVNICKRNKNSSFFVKRRGCLSNFAKTLTKLLKNFQEQKKYRDLSLEV